MDAQDYLIFLCGVLCGAFITVLLVWLLWRRRLQERAVSHESMKEVFTALSKETLIANVDLMNSSLRASLEQLYKANEQERTLSSDRLATVINPLKQSLEEVDKKVSMLESLRQGAYSGLHTQIAGLLKSQQLLQKETNDLSRALNAPAVRGRWGEMQLRRVVELSGLSAHCDFLEQVSVKSEEETVRPDMIVTLPNEKLIIVDAKVPLEFFGFDEAEDKAKAEKLASSLRRHINTLKKKTYFKHVGGSPEFTVMFLPGEAFLHRALVADPMLLDFAAQQEVVIVTPITLVALLKAVAFGFKQEAVATNIEEVRRLAQQLIDRIHKVHEHFEKLGRHLTQATESYNHTLSSLDSRVLVTARKLADIKAVVRAEQDGETELRFVDIVPRLPSPSEAQDST